MGRDELDTLPVTSERAPSARSQRALVVLGGARSAPFALDAVGTIVMGRDCNADVFIDDPAVSRRHALVHVVGDDVWLEDVGSVNGIFVEGERIPARTTLRW